MGRVRAAHFVALHAFVSPILFLVWAEKLVSVKMDKVVWRIGYPYFSFPSNIRCKLPEGCSVEKCSHIDDLGCAVLGKAFEFLKSYGVDWARTMDCFNEKQPVLP